MTPAINFLKKHKLNHTVHKYSVSKDTENYGQAVADELTVEHDRLFKTLLVSLNDEPKNLAVCIVPVSHQLNLKRAAKAHGAKKAEMANPELAQTSTGYMIGGISPFGQKRRLDTVIDESALSFQTIFTSAGKRGLQIEFQPNVLIKALNAKTGLITG